MPHTAQIASTKQKLTETKQALKDLQEKEVFGDEYRRAESPQQANQRLAGRSREAEKRYPLFQTMRMSHFYDEAPYPIHSVVCDQKAMLNMHIYSIYFTLSSAIGFSFVYLRR